MSVNLAKAKRLRPVILPTHAVLRLQERIHERVVEQVVDFFLLRFGEAIGEALWLLSASMIKEWSRLTIS